MLVPFSVIGLNHITSPVDLREHIAFHKDNMDEGLRQFNNIKGVDAGIILSTCNRVELYYYGNSDINNIISWLTEFHHVNYSKLQNIKSCFYNYSGKAGLEHLLRVASGMDSMAIGETQVLGQIKDAYHKSKEMGFLGKNLDGIVQFTFAVAKKARSQTAIGKESTTLAATAVNTSIHVLNDVAEKDALIIGAGDNARLVIEHLRSKGFNKLYIANRTYQKAAEIADKYDGEAVSLIDIEKYLPRVNALFTSTSSPTILVGKGMIEEAVKKWGRKPLYICDMSLPHDVEHSVRDLDQVYLYTLEDLELIIKDKSVLKDNEKLKAEKIIEKEIKSFIHNNGDSAYAMKNYRLIIDDIKKQELAKVLKEDMDEDTREALINLANNLSSKISHGPTSMIKDAYNKADTNSIENINKSLLGKIT
ncbi:MAG: glutamyl-tRNA reductase [Candidatus Portiera sp.]|nr:glutamyl-tRNA reductase [Portiera sp.]